MLEPTTRQFISSSAACAEKPLLMSLLFVIITLQEILGPVAHLRNPQLRERHWNALADVLGKQVDRTPEANTSINTLLDMQVRYSNRIALVSSIMLPPLQLESSPTHQASRGNIQPCVLCSLPVQG